MAGSKLETILAKLTSTTFKGVLLGTLVRGLLETCPTETEISLEAVVPETRTLLKRIVPTAEKSTRRVAVLAL